MSRHSAIRTLGTTSETRRALRFSLSVAFLALTGECFAAESGLFRLFPSTTPSYSVSANASEDLGLFRGVHLTDSDTSSPSSLGWSLVTSDGTVFPNLTPSPALDAPPKSTSLLRRVRPFATLLIAGTAIGYAWGNSQDEIPFHGTFHFTAEGFFGKNTYAGGADKAAHLVDYTVAERAVQMTYRRIGYTETQSQWLGFATALASGLTTEIGDGTTIFGFSWEDFTMDFLGAFSAMSLSRSGGMTRSGSATVL